MRYCLCPVAKLISCRSPTGGAGMDAAGVRGSGWPRHEHLDVNGPAALVGGAQTKKVEIGRRVRLRYGVAVTRGP